MEYNCALIKVDGLAACSALRIVGGVLVVFLRRWRKICTNLQPMGRNVPNPADQLQAKKPGLSTVLQQSPPPPPQKKRL